MSKSKLNPEAKSFDYDRPTVAHDFEEFFKILFTNWGNCNVDSVVSRVESITTIGLAKLLFEELFKIIYDLSKQSATGLKVDNIVVAIDTFDNQLPQIIIEKSQDSATEVIQRYYEIRKDAFEHCFRRILHSFDLVVETESMTFLKELEGVLLVLAKVSKICYYHDYVYIFLKYLWEIYRVHRNNEHIILCILQTLSMMTDRLLTFLLLTIDTKKEKLQKIESKERARFAVEIFFVLKDDIIQKRFTREMIVQVLHILDLHDRFLGKYVDAIPENVLLEEGFILCNTLTKTLEPDEVYDDYEEFLQST